MWPSQNFSMAVRSLSSYVASLLNGHTTFTKDMRALTFGIAAGALLLCGSAQAQIASQEELVWVTGSMHGIIGARSSALGEATSTALGDPGAWNSNPATVAGLRGVGTHHMLGHRSVEAHTISSDWIGAGAWLATPIANIALHYVRRDMGEFQTTFPSGTNSDRIRRYDETITLSLAHDLGSSVALGASVKWMRDRALMMVDDPNETVVTDASGVYVDLGVIGSMRGFFVGSKMRDSIHIGTVIQDIGDRLVFRDVAQSSKMSQWLRLGAGYTISIGDSAATTFRATINGEYRRLLNGGPQQDKTYGGIGIEATALEMVSLRLGTRLFPERRPNLPDAGPWIVFGAGVNLPLHKVGLDLPFTVGIDYAKLPEDDFFPVGKADQLLELRVAYTGKVFGQ